MRQPVRSRTTLFLSLAKLLLLECKQGLFFYERMFTMTIDKINSEIERIKEAIEKTDSEYLKKDYRKYLRRLLKLKKIGSDYRWH